MQKMKAPPVVSEINVTPMVDVMLVLLIIFMVIIPMLSQQIQVELVKAKNAIQMKDAEKEDAVVVFITRDGRVFLSPGNKPVAADQLPDKVKTLQEKRTGTDKTVFLRADYRAKFEGVEDVIDNLRSAGVDTLGFITQPNVNQGQNENL